MNAHRDGTRAHQWIRYTRRRLTPIRVSLILVVVVLVALITDVLGRGDLDDWFGLASGIASGLLVAVVVLLWEQRHRTEINRSRQTILTTLTRHVGAELSPLGAELQSDLDDKGNVVGLFDSIDTALKAYQSHAGVERLMQEVGRRSLKRQAQNDLVGVSVTVMSNFYARLADHLDVFLNHFITAGDERVVAALLDLWTERRRLPTYDPAVEKATRADIIRIVQGQEPLIARAQAKYLGGVQSVLLRYAELLRALEGVKSGIADGTAND